MKTAPRLSARGAAAVLLLVPVATLARDRMLAPLAALRRLDRRRSRVVSALLNSPVAFGLLIIALLAAGWNYLVAESSRDRVAEANAVLFETEHLFSAIKDLETGERGFVLVGDEDHLIPYNAARAAIDESLDTLAHLIHGDLRGSLTGEKSLATLVAEKRDFAARVVGLRKEQGFEAAAELVRTDDGKRTMDAIRLESAAIRARLKERVERIQRSDRFRGAILALLTGAAAWSATALLAGLLLVRREEGRRTAALLEGVLDNAPVGLGFLDGDLTLRRMNPPLAAIGAFGTARGASIWTALPGQRAQLEGPLDAALRDGVTTPEVRLADGARTLTMSVFPVKVPNEQGRPVIEGIGLVVSESGPLRAA